MDNTNEIGKIEVISFVEKLRSLNSGNSTQINYSNSDLSNIEQIKTLQLMNNFKSEDEVNKGINKRNDKIDREENSINSIIFKNTENQRKKIENKKSSIYEMFKNISKSGKDESQNSDFNLKKENKLINLDLIGEKFNSVKAEVDEKYSSRNSSKFSYRFHEHPIFSDNNYRALLSIPSIPYRTNYKDSNNYLSNSIDASNGDESGNKSIVKKLKLNKIKNHPGFNINTNKQLHSIEFNSNNKLFENVKSNLETLIQKSVNIKDNSNKKDQEYKSIPKTINNQSENLVDSEICSLQNNKNMFTHQRKIEKGIIIKQKDLKLGSLNHTINHNLVKQLYNKYNKFELKDENNLIDDTEGKDSLFLDKCQNEDYDQFINLPSTAVNKKDYNKFNFNLNLNLNFENPRRSYLKKISDIEIEHEKLLILDQRNHIEESLLENSENSEKQSRNYTATQNNHSKNYLKENLHPCLINNPNKFGNNKRKSYLIRKNGTILNQAKNNLKNIKF